VNFAALPRKEGAGKPLWIDEHKRNVEKYMK